MSDMKCPVCNKQMKIGTLDLDDSMGTVWMSIMPCDCVCSYGASKAVWQELIRARKALDVAKEGMKEIDELLSSNRFDVKEVPLLNITQTKISMLLKCINIEQKDYAFVYNKIEFPEFNDGLLEEFDKQFFENGQDDDL